jgi:hypothetical protein
MLDDVKEYPYCQHQDTEISGSDQGNSLIYQK